MFVLNKFAGMKLKIFLPFLFVAITCQVNAQNDFELVKQRVVAEIMKSESDDAHVEGLLQSQKRDGSWPGINYEDVSNTGFEHRIHLSYLVEMSLAFNQESSKFFHSKKLKKLINSSLEFWCDQNFFCENWWHNQIGTPTSLVTVLLLMDDQIDPNLKERTLPIIGRAHLDASGARQGGDRIKVGGIAAKKGLVVGDQAKFAEIMKVINEEIKFTTGDRGMQHDFSFHHRVDRVNTTYSYGGSYAIIFAEWAAYVAGTKYAFTADKIAQLTDYYLDGICKQAVYGIYLEKGAMNRGISRKEHFEPMESATPERLISSSDYRSDELKEIVRLRQGESLPSASFARFYWQSEHFVCQRPDFFTSVRMYSTRNRNMEWPYNSEGLLNHHRGDGASFLSVKGDEYLNIWPVYDWQKIPGTTVLQKAQLPPADEIQKDGVTNFVGAVTDGQYAAVAFDFISPHDFIKARKSWFFFDDEYVCLGAGIESESSKLPVVTTLNQSLLNGEVLVADAAGERILASGAHELEGAKWVLHNGTGYIFPRATDILLSNKGQSGRWTDINKQSTTSNEELSKEVFKLWIDHGPRPQGRPGGLNNRSMIAKDVTYQYMIVPSADPDQMENDRGIEMMVNNRQLQAVRDKETGMVQAVFYRAGSLPLPGGKSLSLDSPGAVILKMDGERVQNITVADPSRKLARLHLEISGLKNLVIDLPTGFYAGQSITVEP